MKALKRFKDGDTVYLPGDTYKGKRGAELVKKGFLKKVEKKAAPKTDKKQGKPKGAK